MNQVFGNYRQKMTEERKQKEKAASPPQVQIQEVIHPDSRSVAYRKCPRDGQSTSTQWFTPSDNSFSFNFCPEKTDDHAEAGPENTEDSQATCKQTDVNSKGNLLGTEEGSGFTFSFQIPEDTVSSSPNCEGLASTADTSTDKPSTNHSLSAVKNVAESQEASSQSVSSLGEASGLSANQNLTLEAALQSLTDSSKKKKKKKAQKKNNCAQAEKKVEEHKADTEKSPPAREDGQLGDSDLQRELDWCVEQLKIGLQRKKSTSKQVEEAMRTMKTLRSEKVALVKKRQVMRTMFGDYRQKMEEERQKQLKLMQAAAKSARVTEVPETLRRKSSKVFRKSAQKSNRDTGQDLPTSSQDSTAQPAPNQEGFTFQPSQEPFFFNFL
ncbi:UPF0488 protein C8orf33 homolog isoform X3 [Rana temporaria]|nr:UPF0488 protein C8orf33 homolog isoform X3 [Rana temporaria]